MAREAVVAVGTARPAGQTSRLILVAAIQAPREVARPKPLQDQWVKEAGVTDNHTGRAIAPWLRSSRNQAAALVLR
jgi:hypothetical protein